MSFQQKYLKYKSKYFLLKNQVGGNIHHIFNTLVSRSIPHLKFYMSPAGTKMIVGYLPRYDDEHKDYFAVFDNPNFVEWCNRLVGGTAYNEALTEKTCNELWPIFLAHFEDLASNDLVPNNAYEKNKRTKLLRRWIEYFNSSPAPDTNTKPDITDEELRVIFCNKFKDAVQDTINRKGDEVLPTYPLSYLFYSIFRSL
jgi:hypothetical protein